VISVEHNLAFRAPRQFETVKEHVAWIIGASFARVMIPAILVTVARVIFFASGAGTSAQFDPGHV
jgi:hypothetical protein